MEPALWATRYAMREPALQVLESEYLFERPSTEGMQSTRDTAQLLVDTRVQARYQVPQL